MQRSPSTITREIIRDTKKSDGCGYGVQSSLGTQGIESAKKHKLERFVRLYRYVMEKLKQLLSPHQIESRLKEEYHDDVSMSI